MASQRVSTSSGDSRDSTAIDPQSPLGSPRKPNDEDRRRESVYTHSSSSRLPVGSMASLNPQSASNDAPGWPRLARLMSETPALSAHPRFSELNARNLLYYEAELNNLKVQLIWAEHQHGLPTDCYRQIADDADSHYHQLMLKLRKLLREYNEAALQYSRLCELPDPESFNLRALRSYLRPDDNKDFDILDKMGLDQTWGKSEEEEPSLTICAHLWMILKALVWAQPPVKVKLDLMVTQPQERIDGLTRWVVYHLIPFWWAVQDRWRNREATRTKNDEEKAEKRKKSKPKPKPENTQTSEPSTEQPATLESYSEATALRFTSALSTIVACLIPVIAIAVLTQVSGTRNLLLCITGFAIVFAILLIMLTQGTTSRTEIFAATAAFSAVLVVFISQPDINIQMPPGTDTPIINL